MVVVELGHLRKFDELYDSAPGHHAHALGTETAGSDRVQILVTKGRFEETVLPLLRLLYIRVHEEVVLLLLGRRSIETSVHLVSRTTLLQLSVHFSRSNVVCL